MPAKFHSGEGLLAIGGVEEVSSAERSRSIGVMNDPGYRALRERIRFRMMLSVMAAYGGAGLWAGRNLIGHLFYIGPKAVTFVGISTVAVGLAMFVLAVRAQAHGRAAYYERAERAAIAAADKAVREVTGAADTLGLLNANQRQMEAYASIARSQAATSYRASQAAMGGGLLILLLGGAVAYFVADTATKAVTASLAVIGTAVGGYISRTFITVQQRATEQMGFYFKEPLVQSYILTAERIAHQLDGDVQNVALGKIIDAVLGNLATQTAGDMPTTGKRAHRMKLNEQKPLVEA